MKLLKEYQAEGQNQRWGI